MKDRVFLTAGFIGLQRLLAAALFAQVLSGSARAQVLFSEDFEGLELGDSVHEIVPGQGV